MSWPLLNCKDGWIDASSVISNSELQTLFVVSNLYLDSARPCLMHGIAYCLSRDPICFVANNRNEWCGHPLDLQMKFGECFRDCAAQHFPCEVLIGLGIPVPVHMKVCDDANLPTDRRRTHLPLCDASQETPTLWCKTRGSEIRITFPNWLIEKNLRLPRGQCRRFCSRENLQNPHTSTS